MGKSKFQIVRPSRVTGDEIRMQTACAQLTLQLRKIAEYIEINTTEDTAVAG